MNVPETATGKKRDLRVEKTLQAIAEAYVRLLEQTDINDITVSAIAREARISRKTFYAHYPSIEALQHSLVEQHIIMMIKSIQPLGELSSLDDWIAAFTRLALTELRDSPHINANVIRRMPLASVLGILRAPLTQVCREDLRRRDFAQPENLEYYVTYYLGGLLAAFESWSPHSADPESLDSIIAAVTNAACNGVGSVVQAA